MAFHASRHFFCMQCLLRNIVVGYRKLWRKYFLLFVYAFVFLHNYPNSHMHDSIVGIFLLLGLRRWWRFNCSMQSSMWYRPTWQVAWFLITSVCIYIQQCMHVCVYANEKWLVNYLLLVILRYNVLVISLSYLVIQFLSYVNLP